MRSRPRVTILMAGLLFGLVSLFGCQKGEEKTATPQPPPTNLQAGAAPGKKPAAGGVPDFEDYPAPAGVKTGIEGGRK